MNFATSRLRALATGLLLYSSATVSAQVTCWDQVNTSTVSGGFVIPGAGPVGQEFVPTRTSLETLSLQMNRQSSSSGQARLLIRQGSLTGPVVGSSSIATVTSQIPVTEAVFRFAVPAILAVGRTYVIQVDHVAGGSLGVFLTGFGTNTYSQGRAIARGVFRNDDDLWFKTGFDLPALGVVDQANDGRANGGFVLPVAGPVGQEVRSASTRWEVVEARINVQDPGSVASVVRIRAGSITGPILGTSGVVTASGASMRNVTYRFSPAVNVTPGQRYVLQWERTSGTARLGVATIASNSYPYGSAIFQGNLRPTSDVWFRVGLASSCQSCQRDVGFQGPGRAVLQVCGTGLGPTEQSNFLVQGAAPNAIGWVFFSDPGFGHLPLLSGRLYSGLGLRSALPITTDTDGRLSLRVPGTASTFDIVAQAGIVYQVNPVDVGFTNAVLMQFGR